MGFYGKIGSFYVIHDAFMTQIITSISMDTGTVKKLLEDSSSSNFILGKKEAAYKFILWYKIKTKQEPTYDLFA